MTANDWLRNAGRAVGRARLLLALFRVVLVGGWTGAALAVEAKLDPAAIPFITWMMVTGSALVGYLASSAEMLFGWAENRGWREFGRVVQGLAASMAAGFAAYLLAASAGLSPVLSILAVLPAAYAGENYMRKLADRQAPASRETP